MRIITVLSALVLSALSFSAIAVPINKVDLEVVENI